MGAPITFMCDGCQATLTVPAELAGISGPCPYCAKVITSPAREPRSIFEPQPLMGMLRVAAIPKPIAPLAMPVPTAQAQRPWLAAQLVTPAAEVTPIYRHRRIHPALWAAAGIALFAGGVATVWNLWSPSAIAATSPQKEEGAIIAAAAMHAPIARPSVLATADDPDAPAESTNIPPPSDTKPPAMAATTAVARNVSTSSGNPETAPAAPAETPPPGVVATTPETEMMQTIRKTVPLGGPLARPGEAIIRFLGAATWQERLPYTLAADRMKPLMEAHYRAGGDGPIVPEEVQFMQMEPTEDNPKLHYYSYIVFLPERSTGIPLSVEDTAQGTRVEWRTFIECKDHLLAKFYKAYTPTPATFRALIRRCHYFEKDVPGQDKMQCFELSSPDAANTFYVWAGLDSQVYRKFFASGERARWDVSSRMTLTLEWQKEESGVAWVRLRDVVAESWHPDLLPAGAAK